MGEIPETDREWLEWQAYAFGRLILVPGKPLRERMMLKTFNSLLSD